MNVLTASTTGKVTLIAASAALVIGAAVATYFTWNYQANKYELRISAADKARADQARLQQERLSTAVSKIADEGVKQITNVQQRYETELDTQKTYYEDLLRLNAPTGRLRDPGATTVCPSPSTRGSTAAPTLEHQAGAELSSEASRFLWAEATRADEYTIQLNAVIDLAQTYYSLLVKYGLELEAITATMEKK